MLRRGWTMPNLKLWCAHRRYSRKWSRTLRNPQRRPFYSHLRFWWKGHRASKGWVGRWLSLWRHHKIARRRNHRVTLLWRTTSECLPESVRKSIPTRISRKYWKSYHTWTKMPFSFKQVHISTTDTSITNSIRFMDRTHSKETYFEMLRTCATYSWRKPSIAI